MNIKKHHSFSLLLGLFLILTLSACSNTKTSKGVVKDVQLGTVIAVNKRIIQPEQQKPRGNVGVTVGSGGHSGVYGSVDIATIGRLFSKKKKPQVFFEIIVRRDSGEIVSVTQPATIMFKQGDKVKIVHRKGEARVIH